MSVAVGQSEADPDPERCELRDGLLPREALRDLDPDRLRADPELLPEREPLFDRELERLLVFEARDPLRDLLDLEPDLERRREIRLDARDDRDPSSETIFFRFIFGPPVLSSLLAIFSFSASLSDSLVEIVAFDTIRLFCLFVRPSSVLPRLVAFSFGAPFLRLLFSPGTSLSLSPTSPRPFSFRLRPAVFF